MRKLFYFLPVFVIAVSAFFIVKAKTAKPNVVAYYAYIGNPYDAFERIDPTNYIFAGSTPNGACISGEDLLCGVYCNGDGSKPYITPNSTLENRLYANASYAGVIHYEDASLRK